MAKSSTVRSEDIRAPEAIIAFAHQAFEPQERKNGSKQFTPTLLWPKGTDLSALEKAARDTAVSKWGEKAVQWIKDGLIKSPFLDGDGPQALSKKSGERHPGFAGHRFIRCVSGEDFKPKVFDRKRNPIFDKSEMPSGSRVLPVVNVFTWENEENGKGMSFGISLIQVTRKATGDEILGGGGGPDPEKHFEVLDDEGDAPESTKSGEGAAGLFG